MDVTVLIFSLGERWQELCNSHQLCEAKCAVRSHDVILCPSALQPKESCGVSTLLQHYAVPVGECVCSFALHINRTDNRQIVVQYRNNDFGECTTECREIPGVVTYVGYDYGRPLADRGGGETSRNRKCGVGRRTGAAPPENGNLLRTDIVNADPTILSVFPDDSGQLARLGDTIFGICRQSPDLVENLIHGPCVAPLECPKTLGEG